MNTPLEYDLEMEKAVSQIKEKNHKKVCVQLPDGMKPYADQITEELKEKTGVEVLIWAGSCYGACDVPLQVENLGVDLLIQWGHSIWQY